MKKTNLSVKEFIWYCIAGFIAVGGIIFIVFGIVGDHLDSSFANNFIKNAEAGMAIGFRGLGTILVLVGTFIFVCALCYNGAKVDREIERNVRRQQRMANNVDASFVKSAVNIVEEPKTEDK